MAHLIPLLDSNLHTQPRIVIVGGGLAGIAAAVTLAAARQHVLVIERNRFLGGRAGSVVDRQLDAELDLGQHVYLRCCSRYIALLNRLGVSASAPLQTPLAVPVIDAAIDAGAKSTAWLRAFPLPAGLHMVPSFLAYRHMSLSARLRTARNIAKLRRLDRSHHQFDQITFGDLLRQHGESQQAIDALWNVFFIAALNSDVDEVSAAWGLMLLQEALLSSRSAAEIGVPRVPLSRLLEPARRIVERHEGRIILGQAVRSLQTAGRRITGVSLQDGTEIAASAVILAANYPDLPRLLPTSFAQHPFFADLNELPGRPIIDIHLGFSTPVKLPPWSFATFLNSPIRWLFVHDQGKRLAVSLSCPDPDLASQTANTIRHRIVAELQRLFGIQTPEWAIVRRHRHATFSLAPGMNAYRRPQRTPFPGLYIAGDWTDTGWPSTMEGAVRSGELAAQAILSDYGSSQARVESAATAVSIR